MLNNSILKSIIELENLHWAWGKSKKFTSVYFNNFILQYCVTYCISLLFRQEK